MFALKKYDLKDLLLPFQTKCWRAHLNLLEKKYDLKDLLLPAQTSVWRAHLNLLEKKYDLKDLLLQTQTKCWASTLSKSSHLSGHNALFQAFAPSYSKEQQCLYRSLAISPRARCVCLKNPQLLPFQTKCWRAYLTAKKKSPVATSTNRCLASNPAIFQAGHGHPFRPQCYQLYLMPFSQFPYKLTWHQRANL